MLNRFQRTLTTLRKKQPQTFEECVHTISTRIAQSTETPPHPMLQENLLIMNSMNDKACIIDPQGNVESIDLNDSSRQHNDSR